MLLKFLTKTEVKKNLTISVIGTGLGQLIHLGATPILSRIYSPEAFGEFALFMSFLGVFTAISLLKFDMAIIACEDNEVSGLNKLLKKISYIVTLITLVISISLYFIGHSYFKIFGILTITIFIVNRFWTHRAILNKAKKFKQLSLGKMVDNLSNALLAIIMGFSFLKDFGLFAGKVLGLFTTWLFFRSHSKNLYTEKDETSPKELFNKYSNFPKFSFPAELIGHLNLNSAIFLFTYFFTSVEVGLIGLTTRVLSVPANFVSISFFDVFKQKAVHDYKETGEFRTIFVKFFIVLSALALAMILLIFFTGPILFEWVFGEQWTKAGEYAKYLSFFYAIRLVNSPLCFSFVVVNKQHINLIFQIFYLIAGVLSIGLTYFFTQNDLYCVINFSISLSVLYLLQMFMAYLNTKRK